MNPIEKLLAGFVAEKPNKAYKENSKRRILSYAKKERGEIFILKMLKNIFKPKAGEYLKNVVRERILTFTKRERKSVFDVIGDFFDLSSVRLLGSTIAASFFVVFVIGINNTSAEVESKLVLLEGKVEIKHLGEEWKKVKNPEILGIGDKIRTFDNSLVEIYFYDNSISRISENSEVSINSLTTSPFEIKPTVLKLTSGRIWNQVISGDNKFSVETKNTSVVTKEGIFDIKENGETEINVISKPVEVKVLGGEKIEYSKVSAGYGVKANKNGIKKEKISEGKDDNWTKRNKIADKRYREMLVSNITEKTLDEISILPSNLNYFKKSNKEETNLSIINKRIQELKILNLNNNILLINENKKIIGDLIGKLDTYEKVELLDFLSNEIKKLKIVIPGDDLYEYKIYISKIAKDIDPDKVYTESIVNDRLYEAHEVANTIKDKGMLIVALNNFNEFRKDTGTGEIKKENEDKIKEELANKNDQLFLLQSIENTLEKEKELKKEVSKEKLKLAKEIRELLVIISKDKNTGSNLNNTKSTKIFAETINLIVNRVNKYETENGKKNTLHWILEEIPNEKNSLDLLYSIRSKFDGELSLMVSKKILKAKRGK